MTDSLPVRDRVLALLSDPRLSADSTEDSLSVALLALADEVGWVRVAGALVEVLQDLNLYRYWYDIVTSLFACDCRQRAFPCERSYLIALLYDCLQRHPDLGVPDLDHDHADNLVWSLVHQLKGLDDFTPYDPKCDPQVMKHEIIR